MSDGKIWVVYSSALDDFNGEIYYVTYNGTAWSTQQRLTNNVAQDIAPDVIQIQNGVIWVVWASDREENLNIYYKTSSNGGASWSADTILTTDMASDESPSITQTADGKIWVFWTSKRPYPMGNYDIYYKTYDGSSWSTENQLTTNSYRDRNPGVTKTWDGKIWAFWDTDRNGLQYDLYYKTYDGSSWSSDTRLTTNTGNDAGPSATQALDGLLWVVWHSDRSGQSNIYYRTYDGSSWATETPVVTTNDEDIQASIVNTNDRKIWIVWSQVITPTNFDLYYKTSNPIPIHDVAITGITTSPVMAPPIYQGDRVQISVTAENQGTESETFTVTAYANSTSVGTQSITLGASSSTVVSIVWNTTGFKSGNYIISASASVVPNEYLPHQGDNSLTDGTVRVRLMGDVTDDGTVNIIDLATIGVAYGTSIGDLLYKPEADINHNGTIDITDLATAARNYGKKA